MQYTLRGTVPGLVGQRFVTWEDGALSGDDTLVFLIEERADKLDGMPVGPPEGPYTRRKHLEDPMSALVLAYDVLEPESVEQAGEIPERPDVPFDAIG